MPVRNPQWPFKNPVASRQERGQLSYKVRPRPAKALHYSVRRIGDYCVLALCNIGQEFKHSRIGFLGIIHEDQLQPFTLGGQESWWVLKNLPWGGNVSCG